MVLGIACFSDVPTKKCLNDSHHHQNIANLQVEITDPKALILNILSQLRHLRILRDFCCESRHFGKTKKMNSHSTGGLIKFILQ